MLVHGPMAHFVFHEHHFGESSDVEICNTGCEKHEHSDKEECEWMQVVNSYFADTIIDDNETLEWSSTENHIPHFEFTKHKVLSKSLSRAPPIL
jgi:hypothetical protein